MERLELDEKIREITKVLGGSLKSLGLYPKDHPLVKKSITQAFDLISSLLEELGELVLAIVDDTLVFEGTPIYKLTSSLELFIESLRDCGIEAMIFHRGLKRDEVEGAISLLHENRGIKLTDRKVKTLFRERGITKIVIVTIEKEEEEDDLSMAKEIYQNALSAVTAVLNDIRLGKIPSGKESRKVVQDISSMLTRNKDAMLALTMIKNYDEYTYTHSVNVSVISLAIAESLSLSDTEKVDIGVAGLLHDVGKTQLALDLIRKPSTLTIEEFEEIKKHPDEGYRILSEMEFINPVSGKIVREHHMGYDLSGYPHTEPRYTMEPYSQIVSIADCYDALSTLRTYQKPRPPKESLEVMTKMAGKSLDPAMVKVLIKILGIYPIGTMVRLDTNEAAVVSAQNVEDSTRPKVIVLTDSEGKQLEFPVHLDLSEKDPTTGKYKRNIVTTVNPLLENANPSRSVA
ncbi:MAG: HD domain-containing protein [Deltaproteobacteria bacterium]|nr:HD domain-containing protein [Deltaproteobacteria bacterium]NIS77513.1 HD domain-containing protein [Deltaproteobacteria bacterium]